MTFDPKSTSSDPEGVQFRGFSLYKS